MFVYDASEPFAMRLEPTVNARTESGFKFRLLAYQSGGIPAGGFLVLPEGQGPFPVVVYAPGSMSPAMGWAPDAAALAKKGYAGLLLEEPNMPPFNQFDAPTDIASYVLYATQVRRGLDLLETMPEIDSTRIGFAGWSNGAALGTLLAGLEDRIKAYVFLGVAGMTTYSPQDKKELGAPEGAEFDRWVARMSVIDNIAYVGQNNGAKMLFINGKDDWWAMHDIKAFLAVAPKGATWHVYEGGHFDTFTPRKFLQAWVVKNL